MAAVVVVVVVAAAVVFVAAAVAAALGPAVVAVVIVVAPVVAAAAFADVRQGKCTQGRRGRQLVAGRRISARERGRMVVIPQIDVAEEDLAAGAGLGILDDGAYDVCSARRHDLGRVVGAGDGDCDGLRDLATIFVVDGDREGFGDGVACAQILRGTVGDAIFPADCAFSRTGCAVDGRHEFAAE